MAGLGTLARLTQAASAERIGEQNFRSALFAQGRQEILKGRELRLRESEAIKTRLERNKDRETRKAERAQDDQESALDRASREKIAANRSSGVSGDRLSPVSTISAIAKIGGLENQLQEDIAFNKNERATRLRAKAKGLSVPETPYRATAGQREAINSMKAEVERTRGGQATGLPSQQRNRVNDAKFNDFGELIRIDEGEVGGGQGTRSADEISFAEERRGQSLPPESETGPPLNTSGARGVTPPLVARPVSAEELANPNGEVATQAKTQAPRETLNPNEDQPAQGSVEVSSTAPSIPTPVLIDEPKTRADIDNNKAIYTTKVKEAKQWLSIAESDPSEKIRAAATVRAKSAVAEAKRLESFLEIKPLDKADQNAAQMLSAYVGYLKNAPEAGAVRGRKDKVGQWFQKSETVRTSTRSNRGLKKTGGGLIKVYWNGRQDNADPDSVIRQIVSRQLIDQFNVLMAREGMLHLSPFPVDGDESTSQPKNANDAKQQGIFSDQGDLDRFRSGDAVVRDASK